MSIIYFRKSPNEAWVTIPAIKGADGYTPIKGVDYFTEEEIEAIKADISAGDIDLSGYYTKSEVDTLMQGIEIPEVDLTAYALKTDIPSLEGYAKTADIPDTSSFITIGDVEAKGYQTEAQVLAAINEALGVIENGTY
jgi:hypothetical protein